MESDGMAPICPLCSGFSAGFMTLARGRDQDPGEIHYHQCGECESIFMDAADRMELNAERKRYDAHENDSGQEGYLQYLEPLRAGVVAHHPKGERGLDFGCGPNAVLAARLQEDGLAMSIYDPYFGPYDLTLERSYDFITATEVVEHFHHPYREFQKLKSGLRPGGSLWLMTQLWRPDLDFRKWHYRRDPTHVFFYSEKAFEWLRENLDFAELERPDPRVIRLIEKPAH